MNFLADLFLGTAAIGAAIYCFVLSRRLAALRSLDGGMGSAIAVLSAQVDELGRMLASARESAGQAGTTLNNQTARAEAAARRLELLVAAMHDLPEAPGTAPPSRWPGPAARPAPDSADTMQQTAAVPGRGPSSRAPASPAPRARILRRRPGTESA